MNNITKYEDIVPFIHYLNSLPETAGPFELDPLRALLKYLDCDLRVLKGFHVVGTNGKGSTAVMLSSLLEKHQFKVGFYTSPHLISYLERIQINGKFISVHDFVRILKRIKNVLEKNFRGKRKPTWFEVLTALALIYFSEEEVDFVVLEAGLGGRLDATNIRDWSVVVIPSISLDHTKILGKNITEIALDKTAVIQQGNKVITACKGEAFEVIKKRCQKINADLNWQGKDFNVIRGKDEQIEFSFRNRTVQWNGLELALKGDYQLINASCALEAFIQGSFLWKYNMEKEKVARALKGAYLPGRFEVFSDLIWRDKKFSRLILDGAHNIGGVEKLRDSLEKQGSNAKTVFVFGVMGDKQVAEMINELKQISSHFIFTQSHTKLKRAVKAQRLKEISGLGEAITDLKDALCKAWHLSQEGQNLVCICGSLYLVGEVRKIILNQENSLRSPDHITHNTDALMSH